MNEVTVTLTLSDWLRVINALCSVAESAHAHGDGQTSIRYETIYDRVADQLATDDRDEDEPLPTDGDRQDAAIERAIDRYAGR